MRFTIKAVAFLSFLIVLPAICYMLMAAAYQEHYAEREPSCPAEDSCYPDYYDGEWHIIEGERPW